MDKLHNSTHEALRPQRNDVSGIFSRTFIAMSLKPTLTDELLKVNSTIKIIFCVIKAQCSGR